MKNYSADKRRIGKTVNRRIIMQDKRRISKADKRRISKADKRSIRKADKLRISNADKLRISKADKIRSRKADKRRISTVRQISDMYCRHAECIQTTFQFRDNDNGDYLIETQIQENVLKSLVSKWSNRNEYSVDIMQ